MNRTKYMKRFTYLLAALCVIQGVTSSCGRSRNTVHYELKPVPVKTIRADTTSSAATLSFIGLVEEFTSVPLSFVSGGTVKTICVKESQKVRAGDLLCTVDASRARNMLAASEAALLQAEDGYDRISQVYAAGGATEVKMVEVRTKLEQARNTVETLRKQVDDCSLRAPRSGSIGSIDARVGQNLLPAQPAMTLLGMDEMNVAVSVPESDIRSVKVGEKAVISPNVMPGVTFSGSVTNCSLIQGRLSHSYEVTVSIDDKPAGLLPGMVCRVVFGHDARSGVIIPSDCIQIWQQGKTVWLVRDGKSFRQEITTGEYVPGGVTVTGGIGEGDVIITSGYQKLYNGCPVTFAL